MPVLHSNPARRLAFSAAAAALFGAVFLTAAAARPDDTPLGDAVGAIEGDALAVTGPMSVETVHGRILTVLRSGSDIRVKSGTANIDLVEGGQIAICGPAHLSVLKSGGALTIALDTGTIHAHVERAPGLTIYTPQIQAQPVSIGGGAQDTVVGFDSPGVMCIKADRGAVRVEQQLTGQSVLLPQNSNILLSNGQLDGFRSATPGHCSCELQMAKLEPPPPEVSHLATTEEVHKAEESRKTEEARKPEEPRRKIGDVKPVMPAQTERADVKPVLNTQMERSTVKEEPIYQVFVPPLIFDAKARVQPEIDPKMIVLVRRVRVRPTLIFQGTVTEETVASNVTPPAPAADKVSGPEIGNDSLLNRMRVFVRKLWPKGS